MNEIKNVPELRFPEFLGMWVNHPLKEITSYVDYRGKTPTKTNSGVFLVTAKNIKIGYIDYKSSQEFISNDEYDDVMRRGKPKIGDVLLTTEAPLGNVAQIDREDIALAQRVIKFRAKKGFYNSFIKHYFLSPKFQQLLVRKAIGTTVLGIQGKVLHKLPLTCPQFEEQQKNADFLSSVDKKIEQLTEKHRLLTDYKKGVMQQIFSQQIRFKDDEGNKYPEWEVVRLNKLANINPRTSSLPDSFIYIDLESVEKGRLVKQEKVQLESAPSRAQRLLADNDILFQMVRPYQKNNYFFNGGKGYVGSTGYAQIRYDDVPKFLYYALHLESFVKRVMALCTGTSYPAINSSDLGLIKVYVPSSKEEQQKIADFLTAIDQKIDQAWLQLDQTKAFKKGLLQKMFI